MIYAVTMYAGRCDNCGCEIKLGGGDFTAYGERDLVEEEMGNSDWHVGDGTHAPKGKHYCRDCWSWDDDDKLILNISRQKLKANANKTTTGPDAGNRDGIPPDTQNR